MKVLVCLVLVVFVVGLADARRDRPWWHRPDATAECNGIEYNRNEQVCCDGELKDYPDLPDNGRSRFLHHILRPRCCGEEPYFVGLCCDGTLVEDATRTDKCCQDTTVYNVIEQICCEDGSLIERPDTASQWDPLGCCGVQSYNMRSQFCCGGQIEERDGGNGCCDDIIYDRETQICCSRDGPVVGKPAGFGEDDRFRCCNDVPYNVRTQMCCDGSIEDQYDGTPSRDTRKMCCGAVSYVFSTSVCCNDAVTLRVEDEWEACCGVELFDTHTERCCRADADNAAKYDPATEVCCDGAVLTVTDPSGIPPFPSRGWFWFERRYCSAQ